VKNLSPPLLIERLVYSGRREWGATRVNEEGRIRAAGISGRLHDIHYISVIHLFLKEILGAATAGTADSSLSCVGIFLQ
jgi:hypothetical protein